jgi:hypothetical protein
MRLARYKIPSQEPYVAGIGTGLSRSCVVLISKMNAVACSVILVKPLITQG